MVTLKRGFDVPFAIVELACFTACSGSSAIEPTTLASTQSMSHPPTRAP
jgi:hypothetical protein